MRRCYRGVPIVLTACLGGVSCVSLLNSLISQTVGGEQGSGRGFTTSPLHISSSETTLLKLISTFNNARSGQVDSNTFESLLHLHEILEKIDPPLLTSSTSQDNSSHILVHFGGNDEVLEDIKNSKFGTSRDRHSAMVKGLQSHANGKQKTAKSVMSWMNMQNVRSFWAGNNMIVPDAPPVLLYLLAAMNDVKEVREAPVSHHCVPVLSTVQSEDNAGNGDVEWNIRKIKADSVWDNYDTDGEEVVVANIDTGVRYTHEALSSNWRDDHGWFDPVGETDLPNDHNGHGTHTMGTMAGQEGIGVAPGATWIACKGCGPNSCEAIWLLSCGQWMLMPTNPDGSDPDPTKIPDVISNSWASDVGGNPWYESIIKAWEAAGILHTFAIGNSGPSCGSAGSPGDQRMTFSVGSTTRKDQLSSFSSRGPVGNILGTTKPDIVAPGSNVLSAWHTSDTAYKTLSGTSMATPAVAGTMALMLAVHRMQLQDTAAKLNHEDVVTAIVKSADVQNLRLPVDNRCDGFMSFLLAKPLFPNNYYGHGRINAIKAVRRMRQ